MKVFVLGGGGMLGHQVARRLSQSCEVVATIRKPASPTLIAALEGCRVISGVDFRIPDAPRRLLLDEQPQVVINTAGIVKQRVGVADPVETIELNSLFPHRLAAICRLAGARLIHISTDCVFSGNRGNYREADNPDPLDLYGRTKLLGEVTSDGCLTIRTSIIGLELAHYSGLIEWFLRQPKTVLGYRRARWNGLTTMELARVIDTLVKRSDLGGLWHVSAEPISKYQLLSDLAAHLKLPTAVVPDDTVVIDRSLNSERFRNTLPYTPPAWEQMLQELASAVRDREGNSNA
jgi:dTDP-4-dehydrorhamnose reductase